MTAVDRIPLYHSVRYAVRGLPAVPTQYGAGDLHPSEITLTYRAAPDSGLGRVHAYVAGRIWVDGVETPLLPGGLYGQHYFDGLDGWPEWLATEAQVHDPEAPPSADPTETARLTTELDRARALADDEETLRYLRREGLLVLLARLQRGRTLTAAEALALRQHVEAEIREANTAREVARGNRRHVQILAPELAAAQAAIERVRALRDPIAAALEQADYRLDMRRGDLADSIMPVIVAALHGTETSTET
ncbi:hypothetical protein RM863_12700 [Streptomyces sp. DSM 41014]|uniref:Uncharacterized protein n=1 Tax=Streptomyces hintoniae TaxID=3075521 RepID=A0ABU2UI92_9ACTN|nr:hypothetical protein [Streptomyces sp. DSM 41014]MDT0472983.1 hypothetical protein [Streptomyces sp. DSM 41014]